MAHETVCKTCESCMIEPCHKKYCFLKICCFQTRLKADCSATLTSLNNETLDLTRVFFLDEVTNVVIRLLILAGCSVHVVLVVFSYEVADVSFFPLDRQLFTCQCYLLLTFANS